MVCIVKLFDEAVRNVACFKSIIKKAALSKNQVKQWRCHLAAQPFCCSSRGDEPDWKPGTMNAPLPTVLLRHAALANRLLIKDLSSRTKLNPWEAVDLHAVLAFTIRLVSEPIKVRPSSSRYQLDPPPYVFSEQARVSLFIQYSSIMRQ